MNPKSKAKKIFACALAAVMIAGMTACAGQEADTASAAASCLTKEDITVNETLENSEDGGHAIEVSGKEASYSNIGVTKTGEADGDEADFYGENSAVFATESGTLTIADSLIETNGTHANAVFSYGEGTTVNISDSVIETQGGPGGTPPSGNPPAKPDGESGGQGGPGGTPPSGNPPAKPGSDNQ